MGRLVHPGLARRVAHSLEGVQGVWCDCFGRQIVACNLHIAFSSLESLTPSDISICALSSMDYWVFPKQEKKNKLERRKIE